jgi:hypothetical protein
MFRSFSRVVVVVAVALTLTLSLAPAAHARPRGAETPAVTQTESGWLGGALAWLSRIVSGERPDAGMTSAQAKGTLGSCIDPWGQPIRPCPR